MLQLKVNSEFVDLGTSPVITMDEESPVFEKDSIPGGFSFPFTLPVTDRNRRIFQFPERIEKAGSMTIEQDFELYHTGQLRASGTITVTEADEQYRAYLTVGSGDFSSQIQDKKLNEVDYGGSRTWENKVEFTEDDDFTLFPIWNPNFHDDLPREAAWLSNRWQLNAYDSGLFVVTGSFAICPYPFISYMVRRILNEFGFTVVENVLKTDPEFRKLVLYSTFDATYYTQTTESKWIEVGLDPYNQLPIEEYVDVVTATRAMDTFDLADSMPDVTISDFLKWLRNRLNIAFVFDKFNNVKIIRRDQFVAQHEAEDITSKTAGPSQVISITPPVGFRLSWSHDSDDETFSSDNFKNIEDNLDLYKGTVADTTEMVALSPTLNDIYFVESLDSYMQFAYQDDVGDGTPGYTWVHWSIGFQNYFTEDREEDFSTEISTLRMLNFKRAAGAGPTIRCPWTEQKSNGIERQEPNPFSARLLIYHGMQKDSDDDDVPSGSSDNLDVDGNQITDANLTMKWEGDYGVYEQLWKNYLTWWMARKQVNWAIKDPSTLDFTTRYAIDRNHYFLKKRKVIFTLHEIKPGECEFYLA